MANTNPIPSATRVAQLKALYNQGRHAPVPFSTTSSLPPSLTDKEKHRSSSIGADDKDKDLNNSATPPAPSNITQPPQQQPPQQSTQPSVTRSRSSDPPEPTSMPVSLVQSEDSSQSATRKATKRSRLYGPDGNSGIIAQTAQPTPTASSAPSPATPALATSPTQNTSPVPSPVPREGKSASVGAIPQQSGSSSPASGSPVLPPSQPQPLATPAQPTPPLVAKKDKDDKSKPIKGFHKDKHGKEDHSPELQDESPTSPRAISEDQDSADRGSHTLKKIQATFRKMLPGANI